MIWKNLNSSKVLITLDYAVCESVRIIYTFLCGSKTREVRIVFGCVAPRRITCIYELFVQWRTKIRGVNNGHIKLGSYFIGFQVCMYREMLHSSISGLI